MVVATAPTQILGTLNATLRELSFPNAWKVLGPTLWNIYYDEVLNLPLPGAVNVVGYADDLALVVRLG